MNGLFRGHESLQGTILSVRNYLLIVLLPKKKIALMQIHVFED